MSAEPIRYHAPRGTAEARTLSYRQGDYLPAVWVRLYGPKGGTKSHFEPLALKEARRFALQILNECTRLEDACDQPRTAGTRGSTSNE